jgi:beta-glucosidase
MLAMLFMPLANPAASFAQPPSAPSQSDAQVAERVESLLRQMTLDEKIGQITQVGPDPVGPFGPQPEELIRQGRAGSVLWTIDSARIRKMQETAVKRAVSRSRCCSATM